MNDDNWVYFIGAGASKQDRFPLTNELKHGIAWAVLKERSRFESLAAHLQYLYYVQDDDLEESARIWEDLKRDNDRSQTAPCQHATRNDRQIIPFLPLLMGTRRYQGHVNKKRWWAWQVSFTWIGEH